jgi:glycosyltransferase involved in cell wall biosynthesis
MYGQIDIIPDRPLVSVIVPVYNGGRYIRAALQSIFQQDYYPLEVIVVNDGSTDNTAAIVKAFSDVTYVSREHQGVAAARNAGIEQAHGDFISFLDSDDLWTPQKTSLQMTYLHTYQHVDCAIGHCRYFKEPGVTTPDWLPQKYFEDNSIGYNLGALLARRVVFKKIGLFNPRLWSGEDMDWFIRLRDGGIIMETLPDVLLVRRFHDRNMTYQVRTDRSHLIDIFKASIKRKYAGREKG